MNNSIITFETSTEVKNSSVHGKGLFVNGNISEDEIIMVIKGDVINGIECERREENENNVYIFWNGDDIFIDVSSTDKIKYINHDCNPNCYVDENDASSLFLVASRNIKAGEELTMDYGYEETYDSCNCYTCRKEAG